MEKGKNNEEGIIIPVCDHQVQLVKDIIFLSDEQLNLLGRFIEYIKGKKKEQE